MFCIFADVLIPDIRRIADNRIEFFGFWKSEKIDI